MSVRFQLKCDHDEYSLEIIEKSNFWGKGVKVFIAKSDGTHLNTICYSCHPEFPDFDSYQNKSIHELTLLAFGRIREDMKSEDFKLATQNGFGLLLPINKKINTA